MGLKENLKRERFAHDMTLEEVGNEIGVSRQTILRYESGVIANIPSEKIEGLAALYHTTPACLMGWDAASPQPAFYGGAQKSDARQEDLALLAALRQEDADELCLRGLWAGMDDEHRRSLLQYARFLSGEGAPR